MNIKQFIGDSESGAVFSECRQYRYTLWRRWLPDNRLIAFCGLNPSTADETANDPTITRLIGFARDWGYDGMVMLNAFAFRATDPKVMMACREPIGPENDQAIFSVATQVHSLVLCWGNHASYMNRSHAIRVMLRNMKTHHFGLTASGEPKHPLYLKKTTKLVQFDPTSHQSR